MRRASALDFGGRHSHAAHAGVNLEVNGELSVGAPRPHGALQALDVIQGPDGRRKPVGDHGIFFAAPVAGHQQQAPADAGLTQACALFRGSDAEPPRALGFERPAAVDYPVAIGIALDDRANRRRRNPLGNGFEVFAESTE